MHPHGEDQAGLVRFLDDHVEAVALVDAHDAALAPSGHAVGPHQLQQVLLGESAFGRQIGQAQLGVEELGRELGLPPLGQKGGRLGVRPHLPLALGKHDRGELAHVVSAPGPARVLRDPGPSGRIQHVPAVVHTSCSAPGSPRTKQISWRGSCGSPWAAVNSSSRQCQL